MKNFLICLLLASFVTNMSFAAESESICEGMRESTERVNNKLSLPQSKTKTQIKSATTRQ